MYTTYYTNGNGSCDNLSLNKYQDQEGVSKFYEKNREIFLGNDIYLIHTIMMSCESYIWHLDLRWEKIQLILSVPDLSSKLDMTKKALDQAERKIAELESILNSKEEMIEDLLTTIKEKDSKIRREEQEHVQIQNDLIIKNVKLLQEREENLRIISERSKQIDEYKYYVTELRWGSVEVKYNSWLKMATLESTYSLWVSQWFSKIL